MYLQLPFFDYITAYQILVGFYSFLEKICTLLLLEVIWIMFIENLLKI